MKLKHWRALVVAGALATGTVLSAPLGAGAANDTSVEGCVLQRAPAAALVKTSDDAQVEIDLHLVLGSPFNVKPDSCFRFDGISQGQGQNRVYGQAGWQFLAYSVDDASSHLKVGGDQGKQEDDRVEERSPKGR